MAFFSHFLCGRSLRKRFVSPEAIFGAPAGGFCARSGTGGAQSWPGGARGRSFEGPRGRGEARGGLSGGPMVAGGAPGGGQCIRKGFSACRRGPAGPARRCPVPRASGEVGRKCGTEPSPAADSRSGGFFPLPTRRGVFPSRSAVPSRAEVQLRARGGKVALRQACSGKRRWPRRACRGATGGCGLRFAGAAACLAS